MEKCQTGEACELTEEEKPIEKQRICAGFTESKTDPKRMHNVPYRHREGISDAMRLKITSSTRGTEEKKRNKLLQVAIE